MRGFWKSHAWQTISISSGNIYKMTRPSLPRKGWVLELDRRNNVIESVKRGWISYPKRRILVCRSARLSSSCHSSRKVKILQTRRIFFEGRNRHAVSHGLYGLKTNLAFLLWKCMLFQMGCRIPFRIRKPIWTVFHTPSKTEFRT